MEKRIVFNKYDTEHLYDLALDNFQEECIECDKIKKRLEVFIGKESVKFIKNQNKKYPYRRRDLKNGYRHP